MGTTAPRCGVRRSRAGGARVGGKARAGRAMRYKRSPNALPEPLPADTGEPGKALGRIRRVAVVDHEGTTLHERIRHKPPVTAVEGVVPVVPEHEVVPIRDDQRAPVVT